MIQIKSCDIKLRGSDVDLAIEASLLMRFLYHNNPVVFHEVIKSITKEVENRHGELRCEPETR